MADINQKLSYEISAEDRTQQGTDSALANILKAEQAAKESERRRRQAEREANQARNKEAKETKEVFSAVTAAISGNFEALGKQIASATAKMHGLKLSGMALGAVGLAITAVVSLAKALADAFKDAGDRIREIQAENTEAALKSAADEAKLFADQMERARRESEQQRKAFEDNLQCLREMTKAENEFAKQQELALTTSKEQREEIERRYARADAGNDALIDAEIRAREIQDAQDEIARIEQELENAEDDRNTYGQIARRARSRMSKGKSRTGIWGGFKGWLGFTGKQEDLEQNAKAASAWTEKEQEAITRVADLREKLEGARHRLEMANRKDEIALVQAAADDQKDLNEDFARHDEEVAAAAEESAKRIEEARVEAEERVKEIRLANISELEAREKEALQESAGAHARLAAAQAQVQKAWGWYRNKESLAAVMAEEKANAEAEKQYEKDFDRLRRQRPDWETAKNLSVDQEAVRRVALARQEQESAQRAVASIDAKMDRVVAELAKITEED